LQQLRKEPPTRHLALTPNEAKRSDNFFNYFNSKNEYPFCGYSFYYLVSLVFILYFSRFALSLDKISCISELKIKTRFSRFYFALLSICIIFVMRKQKFG